MSQTVTGRRGATSHEDAADYVLSVDDALAAAKVPQNCRFWAPIALSAITGFGPLCGVLRTAIALRGV